MISLRRKKLGLSERLIDAVKERREVLFWLFLFIIVVAVVDSRNAPVVILFRFFRYSVLVFLLMFMPFFTGFVGFTRSVRRAWLLALIAPLLLSGIYYLIYHESVWRIWYQGEFGREYITGLVKAAAIVPGISLLAGLVFRYWTE